MRDEKQFIRDCAARGYSKSRTAELLGFWPSVFPEYLEVLGLSEVEWVSGHKSKSAQEARHRSGQTRKGVPQLYLTDENREVLRNRIVERSPKYSAFGVTGTLSELTKTFSSVSKNTVQRRIKIGMGIEEALKAPRGDIANRLRKRPDHHPWRVADRISYGNFVERQIQAP